jgi:hypothetical protein
MLRPALLTGSIGLTLTLLISAGCGGDDNVDFSGSVGGTAGATAAGGSSGAAASGQGGAAGGSVGGAGAGGAAGGAAGGGAGSGGDGGGSGPEDCLNGIDDNGDGLTDCADPKCSPAHACVAPAPAGWQAIGWIDAQPGKDCPTGLDLATELYDQSALSAPAADCGCECAAPEGVGCATHLRCNSGSSCSSTGTVKGVAAGCSTFTVPSVNGTNACRAEVPQAGGGSCAPKVTATLPAPSWSPSQRACGASTGGSCANGAEICVPRLAGAQGPCIAKSGDVSCPETGYPQKTLFFDGKTTDSRACAGSDCECAAPQGGTCACAADGCNVRVYGVDNCAAGLNATVPANNTSCITFGDNNNYNNLWGVRLTGVSVSSPGACQAGGSATPTGSVTPSGPVTVCCAP